MTDIGIWVIFGSETLFLQLKSSQAFLKILKYPNIPMDTCGQHWERFSVSFLYYLSYGEKQMLCTTD